MFFFFFFQAEDGIRDYKVTGVQTCALPIWHVLDCPCPWSNICCTLTPRSASIHNVTLGIFFLTVGSLATISSFSVVTPSIFSGPRYVMFHFSSSSLPLAPKPSMNQLWYWLNLVSVVTWFTSFS